MTEKASIISAVKETAEKFFSNVSRSKKMDLHNHRIARITSRLLGKLICNIFKAIVLEWS